MLKETFMKYKILMGITFLITTPAIGAVADSTAIAANVAGLPDVSSLITRMVLSLGVVLLLIWAAVHVLQRISGRSVKPGGTQSHIQVLDRTYLAPKKAVYVLKIGSRSLAVGVTDNHITTLAELDTEETNLAYPTSLPSNGTPSFANLLKDVRTRIAGGQA
ncbi:MAG: flagellar biosynthetic protein FliO [Candidatus Latescibacterota bacterium]|jgi:flagellar biosynthetic protein FliO